MKYLNGIYTILHFKQELFLLDIVLFIFLISFDISIESYTVRNSI